jgi:signal transduction histidine kinase
MRRWFNRLRRRGFGLRGRIVGVVVITTTVTLAVAAAVLLPQLEHSLRHAARQTLVNEVTAAQKDGSIAVLTSVNYADITPGVSAPATQSAPDAKSRAKQARAIQRLHKVEEDSALQLIAAEKSLQTRFGATSVTLIGYIDAQGYGCAITPSTSSVANDNATVPDSDSCDTSALGPLKDVRTAFGNHSTVYSIGGNDVEAAIYLGPHQDSVLVVRKSIDEIPGAVAAVRHAFEIAAIPGMLLTLLLAIPLAGTLVRRLRQLRQAALRLAIDGAGADFPVDRARDEVGDLARSFAIVQRRLRQQEEARRAFVATASHELRTPLASLEGMLELLSDDLQAEQVDLEDAQALLDRARAQSRRLGRLAADLLDLSRIDAEVKLRAEPVELSELGRAVLAEFELRALERHAVSTLDDGGGGIWALADPGSVARIMRILLDNAMRVAPPGTEVAVVLAAGASPSISVSDQGPGVAPEERALIFERFQRGRDTGGQAGFGLGLAIGRELAERMGGSLALADDDRPGATFTLTLRPAQAPVQEAEPTAAGV